jgi:hypothetical protein
MAALHTLGRDSSSVNLDIKESTYDTYGGGSAQGLLLHGGSEGIASFFILRLA